MSKIEYFGLLFFNDDEEKDKFVLKIKNAIKTTTYDGEFCENANNVFISKKRSHWCKDVIVENASECLEEKKYRIVFNCVKQNVYYFEKNGAINCIDDIIKEHTYHFFETKLWRALADKTKTHNENVIVYMNKYIHTEFKHTFAQINTATNENVFPETFNYDYFEFYECFNNIKELNQELKLPSYKKNVCIDTNNRQSETIYNKLVHENNTKKYILLDCRLIDGCEVADLYDKCHNLLFHNKKSGDLRTLSFQIITGALILKNETKREEFINYLKYHNVDNNISNDFKYVIGIIGNNKIAQKDKIALGVVKYILKKHNIELFIDYILIE